MNRYTHGIENDAIRLLNAKAAKANNANVKQNVNTMSVRGETQGGSAKNKSNNLDEIDIGESDEDVRMRWNGEGVTVCEEPVESEKIAKKELRMLKQANPSRVFGGLKKDSVDKHHGFFIFKLKCALLFKKYLCYKLNCSANIVLRLIQKCFK